MKRFLSILIALYLAVFLVGSLSVFADDAPYVFDEADLLTDAEEAQLSAMATDISAEYPTNVYVVTLYDFNELGRSNIEDAAKVYFNAHGLGCGDDRDGMLLMLSMSDRDYALIAHGSYTTTNLTDYGRVKLSEQFVDDFRDDDWFDGFQDYYKVTKDYLYEAKINRPVDIYPKDPPDPKKVRSLGGLISLLLGYPAAALTCAGMKAKLRSVKPATAATQYLNAGSVNFSDRSEVFTHTTQVRTPIPRQSRDDSGGNFGGGGSHVDSGGFAGHSGKF